MPDLQINAVPVTGNVREAWPERLNETSPRMPGWIISLRAHRGQTSAAEDAVPHLLTANVTATAGNR
jgi:hypothetical protein